MHFVSQYNNNITSVIQTGILNNLSGKSKIYRNVWKWNSVLKTSFQKFLKQKISHFDGVQVPFNL